jgi:hypothetical protein
VSTENYTLSSYSSDWGWPLVLPYTFNFSDIEKYYLFFEYVVDVDGTVSDGIVDYDNSNTTIPQNSLLSDLRNNNGIWENVILDTLYQSLSLI